MFQVHVDICRLTGSDDDSTWAFETKAMVIKDVVIKDTYRGRDASNSANQKAFAII